MPGLLLAGEDDHFVIRADSDIEHTADTAGIESPYEGQFASVGFSTIDTLVTGSLPLGTYGGYDEGQPSVFTHINTRPRKLIGIVKEGKVEAYGEYGDIAAVIHLPELCGFIGIHRDAIL